MKEQQRAICQNRKAKFDYEIHETIEAGIVLLGSEVKSLRIGGGSLSDSHVGQDNNGMLMFNFHISTYKFSPKDQTHDPKRNKRLLLHKRQINRLASKIKQKGFTLVPISVYFNKCNRVKVSIALATGKKLFDKRRAIKERDIARDIRRNEKE